MHPPRPAELAAHHVPSFEGTTEYRFSYHPVKLPRGMPGDIGIQVASKPYKSGGTGGQFELMIKQGAPAPSEATKLFMTVVDNQQTAAIVVIAKRPEMSHGVIIGSFSMEGIKPEKVGIPKVEVSLKLADEKTLHAAALYKNGNKSKTLTFRAAKPDPALRQVTQQSEVPEDAY